MYNNSRTFAVDEIKYNRSFLRSRSCPIEGFAFVDTRSHTMKFHLENRGLLDRWPKNSRCKKTPGRKRDACRFPMCLHPPLQSLLFAACNSTSFFLHDFSLLSSAPYDLESSDFTFPPLNLGTPQMSRLRFRTPFVARRHARWRVPAVTSRTCAGLLWRKEPAKYNDPFLQVRRSRWDICTLGRGISPWIYAGNYEQMRYVTICYNCTRAFYQTFALI